MHEHEAFTHVPDLDQCATTEKMHYSRSETRLSPRGTARRRATDQPLKLGAKNCLFVGGKLAGRSAAVVMILSAVYPVQLPMILERMYARCSRPSICIPDRRLDKCCHRWRAC